MIATFSNLNEYSPKTNAAFSNLNDEERKTSARASCLTKNLLLWTLLLVMLAPFAHAEREVLLIQKSRSPDGRYEIWIEPYQSHGFAGGMAKIRNRKTGKYVGEFEWDGFGEHADDTSFEALWRSDDRYLAITWEETRGYMACTVYALQNHRCIEVKLPDDYVDYIRELSGVTELSEKGYHQPIRWLPHGQLEIEMGNRALATPDGESKAYQVIFQIVERKHGPPTARLVSVKRKPKSDLPE